MKFVRTIMVGGKDRIKQERHIKVRERGGGGREGGGGKTEKGYNCLIYSKYKRIRGKRYKLAD